MVIQHNYQPESDLTLSLNHYYHIHTISFQKEKRKGREMLHQLSVNQTLLHSLHLLLFSRCVNPMWILFFLNPYCGSTIIINNLMGTYHQDTPIDYRG